MFSQCNSQYSEVIKNFANVWGISNFAIERWGYFKASSLRNEMEVNKRTLTVTKVLNFKTTTPTFVHLKMIFKEKTPMKWYHSSKNVDKEKTKRQFRPQVCFKNTLMRLLFTAFFQFHDHFLLLKTSVKVRLWILGFNLHFHLTLWVVNLLD